MSEKINRRRFLRNSVIIPAAAGLSGAFENSTAQVKVNRVGDSRMKISCCAYSYRNYITKGEMTLESFVELAARLGLDGVEITAYYFPNYPNKPDVEYVCRLKKKAYLLGLDISGIAIANNFCDPDREKRKKDIENVKMWIDVGALLGAPMIRVIGGKIPKDRTEEEVTPWAVESLAECVEYGKKYGIVHGVENDVGFPERSRQVLNILKQVNSDWIGANLDTGNFGTGDRPYDEIAEVAPYAVSCHVKPMIRKEKADMSRVVNILRGVGYRGYLSIEYGGKEDPMTSIPIFISEIRKAIG